MTMGYSEYMNNKQSWVKMEKKAIAPLFFILVGLAENLQVLGKGRIELGQLAV